MPDPVLLNVLGEAARADAKFGPPASCAEAVGVLWEEFLELTEAVRSRSLPDVEREAVQIAAVALRLARQCREPSAAFRERI